MKSIRQSLRHKIRIGAAVLGLGLMCGSVQVQAENIYDTQDCPKGYHAVIQPQKEVCDHTDQNVEASICIQGITNPKQMSEDANVVENACIIQKPEKSDHPFACEFRISTEDTKDMEGADKISSNALHVVVNQDASMDWKVAYPCTRKESSIANYAYVNYEFVWCEKLKNWHMVRSYHSFLYDAGLDGAAENETHEWRKHEVTAYQTEPNSYQICYEANGGSGQSVVQNAKYDKTIQLKKRIFSREGYRLCGWSLQPDGSKQVVWQPGEAVKNLTETDGGTVTLYAQWQKIYKIKYKLNANGKQGTVPENQKKFETVPCRLTLEPAVVTEPELQSLYRFQGWSTSKDGSTGLWTQQEYSEEADLTLYAQWDTSFCVIYQSGGANRGHRYVDTVLDAAKQYQVQNNETHTQFYKEGTYTELQMVVPCRFMGWSLTQGGPRAYEEGSTCIGETLYQACVSQNGAKSYNDMPSVRLYGVWDWAPALKAEDRYMTLAQAQNREITEDELKRTGKGLDYEKGVYDAHAIELPDYQASDFTKLKHAAVVSVTYRITDDAGNCTEKQIFVHIIDTAPDKKGYVAAENLQKLRFLSREEQESQSLEQTFEERSKWRTKKAYQEVLQSIQETGGGETYEFTAEEVEQMHCYLDAQPPQELVSAEGVEAFYQTFCKEKKNK